MSELDDYLAEDKAALDAYLGVDSKPKEEEGDFFRGASTAIKQLPQLGYGLMAGAGLVGEKVLGEGGLATDLKESGVEGFNEWSAKAQADSKPSDSFTYSWDQAKKGDYGSLVDFVQYGLGYAGTQAIEALVSGGVGGVVGKVALGQVAEKVAGGMVAKEAAKIAGKGAVTDQVKKLAIANTARTIGQTTGVAAQAFGMEGGSIFGDLASGAAEEDRNVSGGELAKAFGATLAAGGLEFVGDKIGLDLVLGKSKLAGKGVGGFAKRTAVAAATAIPIQAGTEYAQTMIEEAGVGRDPFSEEAQRQAIDAAAMGAVGGAGLAPMVGMRNNNAPAPVTKPVTDDTQQTDQTGQTEQTELNQDDLLDQVKADLLKDNLNLDQEEDADFNDTLVKSKEAKSKLDQLKAYEQQRQAEKIVAQAQTESFGDDEATAQFDAANYAIPADHPYLSGEISQDDLAVLADNGVQDAANALMVLKQQDAAVPEVKLPAGDLGNVEKAKEISPVKPTVAPTALVDEPVKKDVTLYNNRGGYGMTRVGNTIIEADTAEGAAEIAGNNPDYSAVNHPTKEGKFTVRTNKAISAQPKPAIKQKPATENILQIIRNEGGIKHSQMADVIGESNAKNSNTVGIFQHSGKDISDLANDHGASFGLDPSDVDGFSKKVSEAIGSDEPVLSLKGEQDKIDADIARQEREIPKDSAQSEDDYQSRDFDTGELLNERPYEHARIEYVKELADNNDTAAVDELKLRKQVDGEQATTEPSDSTISPPPSTVPDQSISKGADEAAQ
ncbi:MAG: hypothetical protein R8K20_12005, partial [Gallionellaceae bacterium]